MSELPELSLPATSAVEGNDLFIFPFLFVVILAKERRYLEEDMTHVHVDWHSCLRARLSSQ